VRRPPRADTYAPITRRAAGAWRVGVDFRHLCATRLASRMRSAQGCRRRPPRRAQRL